MKIKVFANLREITKNSEIETEIKRGKVQDIIDTLIHLYGKAFSDAIFNLEGRLKIIILLNGRDIDYIDGLESEINEEDVLYLFPPIAGG